MKWLGRQAGLLALTLSAAQAAVGIVFNDNSTLAVGPGTQIVIQRFAFDTTTHQGYFETRVQRGTVAVHTVPDRPRRAGNDARAEVLRRLLL